MTTRKSSDISLAEEKKFFWLTIVYVVVLLTIVAIVSFLLWNKTDPVIMYVPVPILEWAFVGSMIAVLYRLTYRKKVWDSNLGLYTWVIAKPIIGLVMGALVYFLALGGGDLLGAAPGALKGEQIYWLNVIAFIGGFSDDLSIGLINRIVAQVLGKDKNDDKDEFGD